VGKALPLLERFRYLLELQQLTREFRQVRLRLHGTSLEELAPPVDDVHPRAG